MSKMTKKELERRYLEKFADNIGCPELKTAIDSEEPDFIYEPKDLGIEVAEMVVDHGSGPKAKGSAIKRDESSFDYFRDRSEAELAGRVVSRGVFVALHERRDGADRRKDDGAAAAVELADMVERELAGVPLDAVGEKTVFESWEAPTMRLALFAERVTLHISPALPKKATIMAPRTGYGQACVQPGLGSLIEEKEQKRANSYSRKCKRNWLLLYSPGPSAASFVDLAYFSGAGIPVNDFERIYVLDVFSGKARLVWKDAAPVESAAA